MEEEAVTRKHSARGMRILRKREPQVIEDTKKILVMKAQHTSEVVQEVLRDIARLAKPNCVTFSKKNVVYPFEDINPIEFLTEKNDCALVAIGSHTKKRPNNLVLGRTYDGHILDLVEFGVEAAQGMDSFEAPKKVLGSKPLFLFVGSQWDTDSLFTRIQNLLLDMFRGVKLDMLSLKGIDHLVMCSIEDSKIMLRVYAVSFMKSGTRVPDVKLTLTGPSVDLVVRRHQLGSADLWKTAIKKPSAYVYWFCLLSLVKLT
jgi:ribosome production factor 2